MNPSTPTGYSGDISGFHHIGTNPRRHTIVPGTKSTLDANKIYTAKWLGYEKTGNGKLSSFFPDSWSRSKVEHAICQAAGSAIVRNSLVKSSKNRYKFSAQVHGITIEGYLTASKKTIVTAYPIKN
ncbi:MAG: hypothetical protein CME32_05150 [Gimesia sp.]|nr:hypothetical protein [Gimesia sp.]